MVTPILNLFLYECQSLYFDPMDCGRKLEYQRELMETSHRKVEMVE